MSKNTHESIYNEERLTKELDRIEQHFFYFESKGKHNLLVDSTHVENEIQHSGCNYVASDFKMNNDYCIFWNS